MAHDAHRARPRGDVRGRRSAASRGPGHVAASGQRRSRVDRLDPALPATPSGAHVLHRGDRVRGGLGVRRVDARLDVPAQPAGHARPDRPDRAVARRDGLDLLRPDHLLLRARPHGLAVAGIAAHHPVDGRGRHAARRAGDGGARVDRHRRAGDPARGRRHGRRHRARAGARRRARDAGGERGVRARARLQRQRGAHPRAAAGSGQPTRYAGRPGRADPRRHQQRPSRSRQRHFPDQRAGGRAGQRGVAAHHPYAGREGRAHHPRAGHRRRHHDRGARRARRRPARPPRAHQPGDRRRRSPPPATG